MPRWHVPWLTPPLKRAIRKKQCLYRKAKQLQTHGKKTHRKATKSKLLKPTTITPPIYWIPQQSLTFPPWVSVSGPLSSQWKSTMWSPLMENGKGEVVHDGRKKADLLLEQFKSVFTQQDLQNLASFHKPPDVVNRLTDNRYQSSMNRLMEIDKERSCDFD